MGGLGVNGKLIIVGVAEPFEVSSVFPHRRTQVDSRLARWQVDRFAGSAALQCANWRKVYE